MESVKLVDEDEGIVEGWAIPFGGPLTGEKDLDGEAFSKDTEFFLDAYDERPLLFEHGNDKTMGMSPIGPSGEWEKRDDGIWLLTQIERAAKYREHLIELAKRGLLGFSSGAHPMSKVKSASGRIEQWMWIETSLTPIPSNPFGMVATKALGLTTPVPIEDQVQICEKVGHFPDAGEVAVWLAERGKVGKAEFSDDMLERLVRLEAELPTGMSERFTRLETNFWDLRSDVGDLQRQLNPDDELKSTKELRAENARLMEAANVPGE